MKVSDIYFIDFKYRTKIQYHEINLVMTQPLMIIESDLEKKSCCDGQPKSKLFSCCISLVRQIFFKVLLIMTNDSSENLEKAQKVRAAESDPE
jgi:hypothetical protein